MLAAVSALFSAIETALFSLQPFHIERLKQRDARLRRGARRLMENPRRLLSVILLCDALANLPLIMLCLFCCRDETCARTCRSGLAALLILRSSFSSAISCRSSLALADPYRVRKIGVRVMRLAHAGLRSSLARAPADQRADRRCDHAGGAEDRAIFSAKRSSKRSWN